jgi:hypothetical protein
MTKRTTKFTDQTCPPIANEDDFYDSGLQVLNKLKMALPRANNKRSLILSGIFKNLDNEFMF